MNWPIRGSGFNWNMWWQVEKWKQSCEQVGRIFKWQIRSWAGRNRPHLHGPYRSRIRSETNHEGISNEGPILGTSSRLTRNDASKSLLSRSLQAQEGSPLNNDRFIYLSIRLSSPATSRFGDLVLLFFVHFSLAYSFHLVRFIARTNSYTV